MNTESPITLIQLVSEQTMQNLLPILRLHPSNLIHFATPKTISRSEHIAEAARQAGINVKLNSPLLSKMPVIRETFNAVKMAIQACRKEKHEPLVNFTGGTKMMSIGAFAAALDQKARSIYVDTEDEQFIDGQTADGCADLFDSDFSFTPFRNSLTVNIIAAAQGRQRVTGGKNWQSYLPLAEHIFNNSQEEQVCHNAIFGLDGLFALFKGREPRKPSEWLQLLGKPINVSPEVANLALDCGLLETGENNTVNLPSVTAEELKRLTQESNIPNFLPALYRAIAPLQQACNLLTGGWWEIIIIDAASRSGLFRDLRWSASVGERSGGPDFEEDILGVAGVKTLYISCKRGGVKSGLLTLLDDINARAKGIGGNFTLRFLAVYLPFGKNLHQNLGKRAKELGIKILTPNNLFQSAAFANPME